MANKQKIEEFEELKLKKELNSLSEKGFLKYKENPDGTVALQLNGRASMDFFKSIGDVPIPAEFYIKYITKKINKDTLVMLISVFSLRYNKANRNLDMLPGTIEANYDEVIFLMNVFSEFYDLDNPRLEIDKQFYFFSLKEKYRVMFENIAKQQNPNDFPKYFLK